MKNHEKAKEFYEQHDPDKEVLESLTAEIRQSYDLEGTMSDIGSNFAYVELDDAICVLEATYEVLQQEQEFIKKKKLNLKDKNKPAEQDNIWSNDELFDIAFWKMYCTAKEYREDIPKALQEYYLKNEHGQVEALGTPSNGIDNTHE